MGRKRTRAGARGQATPEYVGVLLLVCVLLGTLLAFGGLAADGLRLGQLVAEKLVCAVRGSGCAGPAEDLIAAYGPDVAALAREHAPEVRFEDADYVSLPVDPRSCRERRCADTSAKGPSARSYEGMPATVLVHVVDCRSGDQPTPGADCSGAATGNLYVQYWLYYPDSATRTWHRYGYHADDWESYQVKIEPDGSALSRASSHHSYNYEADDPLSDLGTLKIPGTSIEADFRRAGWGPDNGYVWVADGSHAGRAAGDDPFFRSVPRGRLRLTPIEPEEGSFDGLSFDPGLAPPWLKTVWNDPEYDGT